MPNFSRRSKVKLATCHPKLQFLFKEVIKYVDITILCGKRTEQEQQEAFEKGNSKVQWPNSKHNNSPSLAVDCAPYPIDWEDKIRFYEVATIVFREANKMGIKIRWGGHFESFFDGVHFELSSDEVSQENN